MARKENQSLRVSRERIEIETEHASTHICLWLFSALCDYDSVFPKDPAELEHSSTVDDENSGADQEQGNGQKFFSWEKM